MTFKITITLEDHEGKMHQVPLEKIKVIYDQAIDSVNEQWIRAGKPDKSTFRDDFHNTFDNVESIESFIRSYKDFDRGADLYEAVVTGHQEVPQ